MHGPRASCARSPSLQTERDRYRASCKSGLHKAKARDAKGKRLLFKASQTMALCRWGYKKLDTSKPQAHNDGSGAQGCARPRPAARTCCPRTAPHANNKNRFLVTFCRSAKSYPPLAAEALALRQHHHNTRRKPHSGDRKPKPKNNPPKRRFRKILRESPNPFPPTRHRIDDRSDIRLIFRLHRITLHNIPERSRAQKRNDQPHRSRRQQRMQPDIHFSHSTKATQQA